MTEEEYKQKQFNQTCYQIFAAILFIILLIWTSGDYHNWDQNQASGYSEVPD